MDADAKLCILDERHWLDYIKTPCHSCRKVIDSVDHTCSCFDPEIPPDIWNNKKTCPHIEKN